MATKRRELLGSLFGVTAGVGAAVSPGLCAGGACTSCFACIGLGGAVLSLAVARVVFGALSPRFSAGAPSEDVGREADRTADPAGSSAGG
ncbi:MAG TPA: hypothetical protein VLT32_19515 [Candidatus Sulfomarinibacteraceae bacterium]|nr:hypothetical protein [Candidatus Sulfomarinibacteraceae bacterium]